MTITHELPSVTVSVFTFQSDMGKKVYFQQFVPLLNTSNYQKNIVKMCYSHFVIFISILFCFSQKVVKKRKKENNSKMKRKWQQWKMLFGDLRTQKRKNWTSTNQFIWDDTEGNIETENVFTLNDWRLWNYLFFNILSDMVLSIQMIEM